MKKSIVKNILFVVIIALMVIPQSRQHIQILINKGLALLNPSIQTEDEIEQISDYNWMLEDLIGNTYDFNNSKGRVALVNIWATWCPPCIAEMPSLQKLSNDYKDKIDILIVSNENRDIVYRFITQNDYNVPAYVFSGKAPETFNVTSIPRTFLLDRDGNIIIDETGAANWNSKKVRATIDELLKL